MQLVRIATGLLAVLTFCTAILMFIFVCIFHFHRDSILKSVLVAYWNWRPFFFTTIVTDILFRFCVYFLFVSSPDSHGFPCRCSSLLALFVFFTILTEVSRFLCIFSLVLWLKILTVFVVAYDSRTILTEFILFFLTFPFCAFLR